MLSGFPQQMGTKAERKLCKLYKALDDADRSTLMKFAEFLLLEAEQKQSNTSQDNDTGKQHKLTQEAFPKPKRIPAPENENVIKGIKRVSAMYYMVDKSKMFDLTSTLMTEHLMQGRPAKDILVDVEQAFKQEYDKMYNEYYKPTS